MPARAPSCDGPDQRSLQLTFSPAASLPAAFLLADGRFVTSDGSGGTTLARDIKSAASRVSFYALDPCQPSINMDKGMHETQREKESYESRPSFSMKTHSSTAPSKTAVWIIPAARSHSEQLRSGPPAIPEAVGPDEDLLSGLLGRGSGCILSTWRCPVVVLLCRSPKEPVGRLRLTARSPFRTAGFSWRVFRRTECRGVPSAR